MRDGRQPRLFASRPTPRPCTRRRRGEHIGSELEEVRQCRLFADDEYPLAKPLQERKDLQHRRRQPRREHEELLFPSEVRTPEHRSGDIVLTVGCMLLGDVPRTGGLTALVEMCTALGVRIAARPVGPSATADNAVAIKQRRHRPCRQP